MTEVNSESGQADNAGGRPRRRWGRRILAGALLVGLGAVSGFAIGKAHSLPGWAWHAMAHREFNAERVGAHIERRVDRVLSRVDATSDQKAKVSAVMKTAVGDLAALGVKPWEMRARVVELMRADTIDPAALEALRAEQIGKIDAASKRIALAMTEAASVLTPEQRRTLTERWTKRFPR